MKVILFCGGEGMRIRDHAGPLPKPMVAVGPRPILWHLMKYYAHYGHKDFVLCLGHGAQHIKRYFVDYDETVSNDFVMTGGGEVELLRSDIHDWTLTFVDTGLHATVGERLAQVQPFLGDDEWFLANYADGVTDAPLPDVIGYAQARGKALTFLGVCPNYTSHVIRSAADGTVEEIAHVTQIGLRINGGFFVAHRRVFDYLAPGEDLMVEGAARMTRDGELVSYPHDGFWACMDTFKEQQLLEEMHVRGDAPWEVWKANAGGDGHALRAALAPTVHGDGRGDASTAS